jgi:hypothetical protein
MKNIFKIISLMSILFIFGCNKTSQDTPNPANNMKATPSALKNNKDIITEGRKNNYNLTLEQYQSSNTNLQKLLSDLSGFDIAGLKLGMSKDEVMSSLKNYKENFKFKFNNAKINIPESHEYLHYIDAELISREELFEKYGEFFTIFFYQTPNKNFASQIYREIKFERSEQLTFDAILKFLKDKYGNPHTLKSCKNYYDCKLIWKHRYSSNLNNAYNIQYHKDFDVAESLFYPCYDQYVDRKIGAFFNEKEDVFSCGNRLSVKIISHWDNKSMLQMVDSITFNYYDELSLRLASQYTIDFISSVKRLNTNLEEDLLKGNIGQPPFK